MAKVSLTKAVRKQDLGMIEEVVKNALAKYGAGEPTEPKITTVYGEVPVSMVFDEETKWQVITAEYTAICRATEGISKKADKEVEVAKLIANSGVLRHITGAGKAIVDGLL